MLGGAASLPAAEEQAQQQQRSITSKARTPSGRFSGGAFGVFGRSKEEKAEQSEAVALNTSDNVIDLDDDPLAKKDRFNDEEDDDDDDDDEEDGKDRWGRNDDDDEEKDKKSTKAAAASRQRSDSNGNKKWVWIGLALVVIVIIVVVVVVVILLLGGNDDDNMNNRSTTTTPAPSVSAAPSSSLSPSMLLEPSASPTQSDGRTRPPSPPTTTRGPSSASVPTVAPATFAPFALPGFVTDPVLYQLVLNASLDDGLSMALADSPQALAYQWLQNEDNLSKGLVRRRNRQLLSSPSSSENQEEEEEEEDTMRQLQTPLSDNRKLQRYRLMCFFYSTNGPTDWLDRQSFGNGNVSECNWLSGQTLQTGCPIPNNGEDIVLTKLKLRANRVTGQLCPELGKLTTLEELEIDNSSLNYTEGLTGGIPGAWADLNNLQLFKLIGNDLSEQPLPDDLFADWSKIRIIYLARNQLRGKIPSSLYTASTVGQSLQQLLLGQNQLTGPLSGAVVDLKKLTHLFLNDNQLNGDLPPQLAQMITIKELKLGGNKFTGNFPDVSNLVNLRGDLDLSNNAFGGTIPTNVFSKLQNLQQILLAKSGFSGSLASTGLTGLKKIRRMDVSDGNPTHNNGTATNRTVDASAASFFGTLPTELCAVIDQVADGFVWVNCLGDDTMDPSDPDCDATETVCCSCCDCRPVVTGD
ncbi:hypothetical protein ACA910_022603 [Epithemia clementina (nom. ined.)]